LNVSGPFWRWTQCHLEPPVIVFKIFFIVLRKTFSVLEKFIVDLQEFSHSFVKHKKYRSGKKMTILVRLLMVSSWTMLTGILMLMVLVGLLGNSHPIYELIGLPTDLPPAKSWAVAIAGVLFLFGSIALGSLFWSAHKILLRKNATNFLDLAKFLNRCAWSLVAFWIAYALILAALPVVLLYSISLENWPPLEWFVLDPEIAFLVIAFPLFSIASALRRAALIEEENSQFL
jgi:hypothetical protein